MTQPLVSIIISSYNYARFLPEAIDSALSQTFPQVEVIVVDDGSTDDSPEVITSYGKSVIPILKENGGQGSALNAGYAKSQGEIVVFLDSDDALLPTAVSRALAKFQDSRVVKVQWPLLIMDENSQMTGELRWGEDLPEGDFLEDLIRIGPAKVSGTPPTSGNAWSRSLLAHVLPMPEEPLRTGPETYLRTLAPIFGHVANVSDPQTLYRLHGDNWHIKAPLERVRSDIGNLEFTSCVLVEHLGQLGVHVNPSSWTGRSSFHNALVLTEQALNDIDGLVPPDEPFLLLDEDSFGVTGRFEGRPVIQFTQQDGVYCGPPDDDDVAIAELEQERRRGRRYLAIGWPAFWWLDYYPGFHRHLCDNYRSALENECVIIFDLAGSAMASSRAR